MSGRVGVELTPSVVRLAQVAPLTGRVTQTLELAWDPMRPVETVAALRAKAGRPQGISLAIGLGFLQVSRVSLPPVAPAEHARIIELEPDRYFAAAGREKLVATTLPGASIAFGAPAALVTSWIAAFESWAPVEWLEPSPIAVARVLGASNGTWRVEAGAGETGILQLDGGRIVSVRRAPDASSGTALRDVPATGSTPGSFAAALGAAKWRPHHAQGAAALAPDAWRQRLTTRRRAATVISALALAAGILFAAWSADRWRERTLAALDERIAGVEAQVAPADTALRMLRSRELEAATIRDVAASRPDPFLALAAISATLPREANVLSARATGDNWQLDGTTSDASALVPLLDRHEQFDSVRFLSASSRYRDANRSYETFSIALRFRPRD